MDTLNHPLLLRADALWNGRAASTFRPGALLVEGERIAAVGQYLAPPAKAEILDLAGCTLIPGLIDMHGHARLNARQVGPSASSELAPSAVEGQALAAQVSDEPVRYILHSLANLQQDLQTGVTTVKTNGDRDFLDVGLRAAIRDGLALGPRLFVATRGIKAPNSSAGIVATALCRGPAQIQTAIRENLAAGADFIKIYVSGGLLEPLEEACTAYYSLEEIRAAVEAAAERGTYVVAHCVGGPGATWCAEAGVRVLEHGYYLTDEQLTLLREGRVWLDITLGVCFHPEGHASQAIRQGADPAELASRERRARDTVRRAIASGTPFVLGTDSMHGLLVYEADQVVALGGTPQAALRGMTLEAAKALDQTEKLGSLEPGKLADIVAVDGDPLAEIGALRRVRAVFKNGQRIPLPSGGGEGKDQGVAEEPSP